MKNLLALIKREERARDGGGIVAQSRSQDINERDLSRAEKVRSKLQPRGTQSQSQRPNLIPMLPPNRSAQLERDGEDLMEHAVGNR